MTMPYPDVYENPYLLTFALWVDNGDADTILVHINPQSVSFIQESFGSWRRKMGGEIQPVDRQNALIVMGNTSVRVFDDDYAIQPQAGRNPSGMIPVSEDMFVEGRNYPRHVASRIKVALIESCRGQSVIQTKKGL